MPSLEMRGAAMSLTAAATGFVVLLLSASVIQGEGELGVTYTSTQICALKGSTVTIRCSYKHPARKDGIDIKVEKTFWFTERRGDEYIDLKTVSGYSNRVQDHCEKNDCTLTIRNLRERDSAEYYFRFITNKDKYYGQPGVTLSVTDLDVWVSKYSHQYLQCRSSCPSDQTSYIWYKNGQKLEETSAYLRFKYGSADSYSCALRGYEDFPSPSLYAPKTPVVSVSPSAEIMEGTSVTLTCSSDAKPAATYTWYKENGRYFQKKPKFVFGSIRPSDSGEYYCQAENELGRRTSEHIYLDVKYAPKTLFVLKRASETVEGSSVTLFCSSDANPAATYTWYKENQELHQGPEGIYNFKSIRSEDRGNYSCMSENQFGSIMSLSVSVDVQYAPKTPDVSVSPSAEIVEGSSVTLTCSSDANPAANYTWYKENQELHQGPEKWYHFTPIRSEDRGNYSCMSENQFGSVTSLSVSVDVQYAPKHPSVSVSPSEIVEGSSVNLTCSSDANPAANYSWYKEDEDSPKASGQIFTITDFSTEDSGNYYCVAQNRRGRQNSYLHPITVAGNSSMMNIIRLILGLLVLIPLLLLCLRKREKKSLNSSTEPHEPGEIEFDSSRDYENDCVAQREDSEEQEDQL